MNIKLNLKPKFAYLVSIFTTLIIFIFFSYKALVAYLIHRELYGGGLDILVLLRASIAGIMFLLILLFIGGPARTRTWDQYIMSVLL